MADQAGDGRASQAPTARLAVNPALAVPGSPGVALAVPGSPGVGPAGSPLRRAPDSPSLGPGSPSLKRVRRAPGHLADDEDVVRRNSAVAGSSSPLMRPVGSPVTPHQVFAGLMNTRSREEETPEVKQAVEKNKKRQNDLLI